MDKHLKDHIISHYKEIVPNQWNLIKKRLARQLANELLTSLEELSDPQGKELIDFRREYLSKVNKNNRMGA